MSSPPFISLLPIERSWVIVVYDSLAFGPPAIFSGPCSWFFPSNTVNSSLFLAVLDSPPISLMEIPSLVKVCFVYWIFCGVFIHCGDFFVFWWSPLLIEIFLCAHEEDPFLFSHFTHHPGSLSLTVSWDCVDYRVTAPDHAADTDSLSQPSWQSRLNSI